MLWQRTRFWSDWGNIFDAAVSVLSILSLVLYLDHLSKDLELVVLLMMTMWVGLRLARLVLVARRLHSRRLESKQQLDVDFGCGDEDEEAQAESSGIELMPALLDSGPRLLAGHAQLSIPSVSEPLPEGLAPPPGMGSPRSSTESAG